MRTLFILIALFMSASGVGFAAPVMKVDQPKFDFGEVYQGDKVPHVFTFSNEGDVALKIDRVRSSCGCTAVLLSEKTIPPGGSGEIRANFDSARFRGDVSKTIYVYTNDPVQATWQLQIKGRVLEIVAAEPARVNFGGVLAEEPISWKVVLRNQGKQPLTVGKPKSTAEELAVTLSQSDFAPGDEITLELTLTPKPGRGRFSGYALVPITGIPKNELRIPVYATIRQK